MEGFWVSCGVWWPVGKFFPKCFPPKKKNQFGSWLAGFHSWQGSSVARAESFLISYIYSLSVFQLQSVLHQTLAEIRIRIPTVHLARRKLCLLLNSSCLFARPPWHWSKLTSCANVRLLIPLFPWSRWSVIFPGHVISNSFTYHLDTPWPAVLSELDLNQCVNPRRGDGPELKIPPASLRLCLALSLPDSSSPASLQI